MKLFGDVVIGRRHFVFLFLFVQSLNDEECYENKKIRNFDKKCWRWSRPVSSSCRRRWIWSLLQSFPAFLVPPTSINSRETSFDCDFGFYNKFVAWSEVDIHQILSDIETTVAGAPSSYFLLHNSKTTFETKLA